MRVSFGFCALALMSMSAPYAWGREIGGKYCGGSAKITSVDVVPCDEGEPCEFPKGETAHVTIKGVANDDIQEAKLDTTLSVLGLQVPVPGVERDFCKIVSEPGCPIMAGQPFVADFDIPVSSIIPVTKTTLTVKVTGQAGVAVCLKVPVILK